jgi:hypothetical protein
MSRNLQRSKEQCKANRAQTKATWCKGKPQQAKVTDAAPAEFAGEASRVLSPSDLTTDHSWNRDTGATCHMTPHKQWLTHYRAHRVPVRLGDNSVVWSEGIVSAGLSQCLRGALRPLSASLMSLCTPPCVQSTVSVHSHCPWLHLHWYWLHPRLQQR